MQTTNVTKKRAKMFFTTKTVFKQLAPTLILVALFVLMFSVFVYCYYNVFFPLKYTSQIKSISADYNVNSALVASLINAESKFEPNCISNKGAIGLMQLLPSTASFIAEQENIEYTSSTQLKNVSVNLRLGIAYISYLLNKFPDTYTMLCSYNAGEGNVTQWLKNHKYSNNGETLITTPFKETNTYAKKVLRNIPLYKARLK